VQLELSQITYMREEPPFAFEESRAAEIRPLLRRLLEATIDWLSRPSDTAPGDAPITAHETTRTI
jgi:N-formylglutamate amidohydrolase